MPMPMPEPARSAAVVALLVLAVFTGCARGPVPPAGRPAPAEGAPQRPFWWEVPPRNGLEVIGWMRRAHPSRELKSLRVTLTTEHHDGAARATQAVVTVRLPVAGDGGMPGTRTSDGRGGGRHTASESGSSAARARRVDLRSLLAFDVFAQNADTTIMWLDSARVRFGLARRGEWSGRRVWIVGAETGDTTSSQFWVDADQWRVVRIIQRDPSDDQLTDVRYTDYTELLGVPVPTRMEVWREGRLTEVHTMSDIVVNPQ